jgi:hypothetical protein
VRNNPFRASGSVRDHSGPWLTGDRVTAKYLLEYVIEWDATGPLGPSF